MEVKEIPRAVLGVIAEQVDVPASAFANSTLLEEIERLNEILEGAPQSIQFPDDENITRSNIAKCFIESLTFKCAHQPSHHEKTFHTPPPGAHHLAMPRSARALRHEYIQFSLKPLPLFSLTHLKKEKLRL
jgi:hypothetical protein